MPCPPVPYTSCSISSLLSLEESLQQCAHFSSTIARTLLNSLTAPYSSGTTPVKRILELLLSSHEIIVNIQRLFYHNILIIIPNYLLFSNTHYLSWHSIHNVVKFRSVMAWSSHLTHPFRFRGQNLKYASFFPGLLAHAIS